MAKAAKSVARETEGDVSQETPVEVLTAEPGVIEPVEVARVCANCRSWHPEHASTFGGCAKTGLTTTHYGETRYVHYTPDGASCSAFEAKE